VIDRHIHQAQALLVDNNALTRSVAAGQLRDAGVANLTLATSTKDARLLIERERFDIIVCNREFEGTDESGQDLLDELRREHLLPHSTVFLMIATQASYNEVLEAGEAALDGLLIRPYSTSTLLDRLGEARQRKAQLADVLRALDAGENEVALARAMKRYQDRLPFATYCGRLVAELFLTMNRAQDAQRMFEHLASAKQSTWARLGIARAQVARNDLGGARKTLESVLRDDPGSADASELLGRLLVEQSDHAGALAAYQKAAELTPGSLLRVQQAGTLAYFQGHSAQALQWMTRALSLGTQSRLFDPQTFVLLALLKHDTNDATGVAAVREQLRRYLQRARPDGRLQRMEQATTVLSGLARGDHHQAATGLRALADASAGDDFDMEAASLLLALLHRTPAPLQAEIGAEGMVERLGMRFCTSKAVTEVLLAHAARTDPAESVLRQCQSKVSAIAESAMDLSLQGQPGQAVQQLLCAGEQTLNAKLLDLARSLAERQRARLPDAQALIDRASQRLRTLNTGRQGLLGASSGRTPGGLKLRAKSTAPAES
jgi:tetratricopeptide (TPR) repeat protein